MGLTPKHIAAWFKTGYETKDQQGFTHMLVVTDTFSYEDFPVYASGIDDLNKKLSEYNHVDTMTKVMEVYSLYLDMESQIKERRAWHLDIKKEYEEDVIEEVDIDPPDLSPHLCSKCTHNQVCMIQDTYENIMIFTTTKIDIVGCNEYKSQ